MNTLILGDYMAFVPLVVLKDHCDLLWVGLNLSWQTTSWPEAEGLPVPGPFNLVNLEGSGSE